MVVLRYFLFTLLFSISSFITGQNRKNDTLALEVSLKKDFENSKIIMSKYEQLRFEKDVFLYKEAGKQYTYYDRLKYDSLKISKNSDSIALAKSMLRIKKGVFEYYVFENEFHLGNYILMTTKHNVLTSIESFNYKNKSYNKKDLISKILYTYYDGEDERIPRYTISVYKNLDKNNNLFDILFTKTVYLDKRTVEQNYEKDFTLSEGDILKLLPEKFLKQAPILMKGQKFIYDYNDKNFNREFTVKEAKFESENIKSLISRKKITLEKRYTTNDNSPFYSVSIDAEPRVWEIDLDPNTGNIIKLKFWGLLKD